MKDRTFGLVKGYWVAIALKEPVGSARCYVGQVEEVAEHGMRITLIDWMIGRAASWDFWVPWANVLACLTATPQHDVASFGEAAGLFQMRHNGATPEEIAEYRKNLDTRRRD